MSLSHSEVYDALYQRGTEILAEYQPCNIRPRTNKGQVEGVLCSNPQYTDGSACCIGCEHLGPQGCTVKALACKLWLCFHLKTTKPELATKLSELRRCADNARIPLLIRATKEETLSHMNGRLKFGEKLSSGYGCWR